MSTQINVKCIDQTLALVSTPLIASGGVNEDVVNFTFCQKWDGFSKTAVFYRKPEDVYYNLVDSDNACVIPQEVLKEDGYLYFGVFGSNANGVTRTSEVLKYKIEKGAITENIKPSDPTPSIYEQLLAKYQEILELCEDTATAESEFEALITNKQNTFENKISKQQNDYETDLSNQWAEYKTNLTNQQTEFETSTTEKLNTYEENVESIAETSAKNAINTASQDKTVTLSTTWQYDSTNGYYTQNVAVVGMKATDRPILGIETSGNASNITSLRKEWSKVIQAETYDDGIKFYAKSATSVNLTVVIKPELSKVTVNLAEAGLEELQEQVNTNTNNISSLQNQGTTVEQPNAGYHNAIYRGKFLGNEVTEAQYSAISSGTFSDLYIGDYWTINDINYRIACFDYYLNTNTAPKVSTHHIIIVPDSCLSEGLINYSGKRDYYGSSMRTTLYTKVIQPIINVAFEGHVFTPEIYFQSVSGTDGYQQGGRWYDSYGAELMTEQMVFGCSLFSPMTNGSNIANNLKLETKQLPLFRHDPSRIPIEKEWWLRDNSDETHYVYVEKSGLASINDFTLSKGIRPYICIC